MTSLTGFLVAEYGQEEGLSKVVLGGAFLVRVAEHGAGHKKDTSFGIGSTRRSSPNCIVVEEATHLEMVGSDGLGAVGGVGAKALPAGFANADLVRPVANAGPGDVLRR